MGKKRIFGVFVVFLMLVGLLYCQTLLKKSQDVTFTVADARDFNIYIGNPIGDPAHITIPKGESWAFNLEVWFNNSWFHDITLTCPDVPPGITVEFENNPLTQEDRYEVDGELRSKTRMIVTVSSEAVVGDVELLIFGEETVR